RGLQRRRDGIGIAQSLRRNPVLTIGAVKIAAQHTEAVGQSSGMRMKEWLLLDRVALGSGSVSPGDIERAAAVVADFADTGLAVWDGAAMAASEAAYAVVVELLVKAGIGLANSLVENTAEGGHGRPLIYSNAAEWSWLGPSGFGLRLAAGLWLGARLMLLVPDLSLLFDG